MEIKTSSEIDETLENIGHDPTHEEFWDKKWVAVEDVIKLLNSKRNISDIAYTHRNEVIDSLINEFTKSNKL